MKSEQDPMDVDVISASHDEEPVQQVIEMESNVA